MTTVTSMEAGVSDAELAVMRQAAKLGEPRGEDPFSALALPFTPPPLGTRAGYPRCCGGAHHFCITLSNDA